MKTPSPQPDRSMLRPATLPRRRALLGAAALAVSAAASTSSRGQSGAKLRVLCYNIHYGQGMDGVYDIPRLAAVINETKPDIVALQECDVGVRRSGRVHQVIELGKLTGLASRFGPTQHYEGGLFGNAILTRLPILDVQIHPLPYTEATEALVTYPRGVVAVTVEAPDGQPLRLLSTHFQHNVPEDRVAEARAINALFADPEDGIRSILAGDINALPDSEPVAILEERWSNVIEDPPAPTIPVVNPTRRIDYIFHRPAEAFEVVETRVIPEEMASDHLPVFAELALV